MSPDSPDGNIGTAESRDEISRLSEAVSDVLSGALPPEEFRHRRVIYGIYPVRGASDRCLIRVRIPLGRPTPAHLLALAFPSSWAALIGAPVRLYALEVTGLALGVMTIVGLALLILRRLRNPRAFVVTSPMDWVLLGALLVQVGLGFWVALFYRWGSDWYLHTAVPWLVSLLTLKPQVQFVAALPWLVKLHMVGGFVIIALFPFTRLVHVVTFPMRYLWRPYQVVVWNRRPMRT